MTTGIMGEATWQGLMGCVPLLAAGKWMNWFWQNKLEWYIFWFAVLAAVLAVGYYFIKKIRPEPEKKEPQASQWLSKYREMHSEGELSDEEFRTIKTKLAEQLQDELNDNGESG
jgi:uncharacterized membrane protein